MPEIQKFDFLGSALICYSRCCPETGLNLFSVKFIF